MRPGPTECRKNVNREDSLDVVPHGRFCWKIGGSAWESNPPGTFLAPHTGFEVRELHQIAAHFRACKVCI